MPCAGLPWIQRTPLLEAESRLRSRRLSCYPPAREVRGSTMLPPDVTGLLSLLLTAWSIKSSSATGERLLEVGSRTSAYLRRVLGPHASLVEQLAHVSGSYQDLVSLLVNSVLGRKSFTERALLDALNQAPGTQAKNAAACIDTPRFRAADMESRDAATLLLLCQQTAQHMLCLQTIPLHELYIPPTLRDHERGIASKSLHSFRCEEFEAVVITGQYGRGKSTLLKMAATCYIDPGWLGRANESAIPLYITAPDLARIRPRVPSLLDAIATAARDRYGVDGHQTLEPA